MQSGTYQLKISSKIIWHGPSILSNLKTWAKELRCRGLENTYQVYIKLIITDKGEGCDLMPPFPLPISNALEYVTSKGKIIS